MSVFSTGLLADLRNLRDKCAGEGCCVNRLRSPLMGHKGGIRLGEDWFCGPECFRLAIQIKIQQLLRSASPRLPRRKSRLPLGLLLLSRGCVTREQLAVAVEQQRRRGGALGDILCEMNFATERDVAAAAATQWGCPVFRPAGRVAEIQTSIPAALKRLYSMAPVHYSASSNKLFIGFVYGIEHHVLHTIEDITSCLTEPCVITSSQFLECRHNVASQSNDVTFDGISTASEAARIIQSYAFEIGSDEGRIGICGDYVWMRLNCNGQPTDLLFSICPNTKDEMDCLQASLSSY